jgi:pyruvate dehydrogenase E2 component (dihydrolipoamide acetyltransferase)
MGLFNMPSLGADMEAGILVEWLKKPGEGVKRGDIVAVVETEKGAIEIEIFEEGRIERLLVEPGTKVPVGTPLASIAGTGEMMAATPATTAPRAPPEAEVPSALSVPAAAAVPAASAVRASPAARQLAAELRVDLARVKGTGPEGAVTREDVARSVQSKPGHGLDLGQMRHAIAAAMARSKREIPHYYLSHSLDVSGALEALQAYNATQPPVDRILFAAIIIKAVALALKEFPEFNGAYGPDGHRPSEAVHLGMAIAIRGGGLVAPAIHDTDTLAVPELMSKMRDLVGRARRGEFRSSELGDATATVSSLGDRGVDALFPVIYPPQVAILGFGTVAQRPWVVEDKVQPRSVLTVTLSADHRVSDGHRGALFLQRVAALLTETDAL